MPSHLTIERLPLHRWVQAINRLHPYRTPRAIWLAAISAVIMSGVMQLGAIDPTTHRVHADFHIAFISVANLCIFTLLYSFNFWIIRCGMKGTKLVAVGIAGAIIIAVAFTALSFGLESAVYGQGHTSNSFVLNLIINATAALIAYLITLLINNLTSYQQMLIENEHLQAENILIRYETLERQVSPHFLFNSLNTLDGLIGIDDSMAHAYLRHLSSIFRYNMQKQRAVALADELEFAHSYIYLMQIRYGNALSVAEHIDPEFLNCQLPAISVQLLIENAIKHNVATSHLPLEVDIETTPEGVLRVSNRIQPKADQEGSSGIGLDNLNQRYRLLFGKGITIHNDGHVFAVEIPLIANP